ncbi:hypothetical protein DFS34DRAFT_696225 [Phlyctochytrium arcticum]|nr:hypothetical protein DFS34DRAFT_696225 [Phlyctochytrium arcticum]
MIALISKKLIAKFRDIKLVASSMIKDTPVRVTPVHVKSKSSSSGHILAIFSRQASSIWKFSETSSFRRFFRKGKTMTKRFLVISSDLAIDSSSKDVHLVSDHDTCGEIKPRTKDWVNSSYQVQCTAIGKLTGLDTDLLGWLGPQKVDYDLPDPDNTMGRSALERNLPDPVFLQVFLVAAEFERESADRPDCQSSGTDVVGQLDAKHAIRSSEQAKFWCRYRSPPRFSPVSHSGVVSRPSYRRY